MAYYLVSYDLIDGKDYGRIIGRLVELDAEKILLSTWFVELSNEDAADVRDHLKAYVDTDDRLIVVKFDKRPRITRGLSKGVDWVTQRFG